MRQAGHVVESRVHDQLVLLQLGDGGQARAIVTHLPRSYLEPTRTGKK
jgi:hypothetical protein